VNIINLPSLLRNHRHIVANMRAFGILLACPAITLAAMIPRQADGVPPGPWVAGLWHFAEEITLWGTPINANGGRFWLGKDSSTYCPSDVDNLDCSAYTQTSAAFVGGNGTISMDVVVPGGQQGKRIPALVSNHAIAGV
jgi:hypothetical protein